LDKNADSPYNPNTFSCSYVDVNTLCNMPSKYKNITIMSYNVQSLQAKFSELRDFLDLAASLNFQPDIILVQEIWQVPDPNIFCLKSFQPIFFKCRERGQGGGVGVYVIFLDRVFESILIDIVVDNKKFTVGSLYRCISKHPTLQPKDQFASFNDLLYNMLDKLSNSELILGGDINLDVIKY
jgi:exonuclease III